MLIKVYFFQGNISKLENIEVSKEIYLLQMLQKLSEIPIGKFVRINSFVKNDIFLKLMEMGCIPGETISVDQIAPLGDPISITVAGYHLSLRLDEAELIWVEDIALNGKSK